MYIDAVCNGMGELPTVSDELREKMKDRLQQEGLESLCEELGNTRQPRPRRQRHSGNKRIPVGGLDRSQNKNDQRHIPCAIERQYTRRNIHAKRVFDTSRTDKRNP